ncbi:matrixin family metalloprotease [Clostridium pasteurianum]|uniref:Matrixin n=1 Tax=Clostridium pasteurianum BC1 TaxID=86416 RepID=R4K0C1_CLOPA|nr:matrixin family metalloprotease [Clostridium pasteurianum]AGK96512.1 Matrixin [Clostridium pasteurianum BC1]
MRAKKCIFTILFISILLVIFYSISVFAYNTFNEHTRSSRVDPMYYSIDSSANSYSSAIFDGVGAWNDSSHYTRLLYNSDAADVFFSADAFADESAHIIAKTLFISVDADFQLYSVNPNVSNWDINLIEINTLVMPKLTAYKQQGTMAHELGHAMGLAHNTNPHSIMCQLKDHRAVNYPTTDDINGIIHLYY